MAKQLIATLTTDSNGEATYNYTGVGAGETTFIAESGELESNSLTVYDILMELTVVSDKDILSYADGDTATITATLEVEGQPAPNNMIAISKYPDFFDGTYFYIPFEQGEENWEIYFGGTIQVLREDKTLYNSFSGTAYISYKAEYESVSMAQYMQESFSLSDFPEKGFICLESPTQIGSISGFDIQRLYTDNSGTVNITYESEGAGDVCLSIIAVYDSIFLQETYSIEDCLLYRANVSGSDTFDVSLPSHFEITATVTKTASSYAFSYFQVDNYDVGSLTANGRLFIRKIGDVIIASTSDGVIQLNQLTTLKYEFNNGTHTVTANGQSATGIDSTSTGNFKKLFIQNYSASELKIKPL